MKEGTTTTPFDRVVRNDLDRFHLVNDVIDRVPGLAARATYTKRTDSKGKAETIFHPQQRTVAPLSSRSTSPVPFEKKTSL